MKWGMVDQDRRHQIIDNLPSEVCAISRRVWRGYWQVFGLAGAAIRLNSFSTNPSSRLWRKPVVLGCSFLLTAAGQSRLHTGFPLRAPSERDQQAKFNIKYALNNVNAKERRGIAAIVPGFYTGLI
jgi:hypothetical protein